MHPSQIHNAFCEHPIDRQAIRRGDTAWLEQTMAEGPARFLGVESGTVSMANEAGAPTLAWSERPIAEASEHIFLGMREGMAYFACVCPATTGFAELRGVAPALPADQAGLAAYAVALARWHARHRFCGVCGSPTIAAEAGHKRICANSACAADHFPRTDPAIIVLVEHGDACFLARNAKYRPGMHSTLAGFVEPGESLEAAVRREVWEEARITLGSLRYHSSQPWPFPASLMLGYHAEAVSRDFQVDNDEIVEGNWFTREQLIPYLDGSPGDEAFNLPGRLSISRRLIEDWINDT